MTGIEEFDLDVEIQEVMLGAMQGETALRGSIKAIAEHYSIEDDSITPKEVGIQLMTIEIEYSRGIINEQVREQRLRAVIARGVNAKESVSTGEALEA